MANTVVNVSISALPTFLAILNKSLFLKSPLYHEITKKMINDITAIMIKINDAEGGDIIFVIDGMCGRNVNIKNTWKTSTTDKIGPDFFIYGIRMFSAGNKNLICPDSVGSFKREINGTNYDLITSSDNEDNAKKLKDMTKICVVLDSDNAQQWDTFFENNVQNKG
ncbi:hypothetical protein ACYCIR_26130 [Klebsiella pneumoniae]